MHIWVYIFLIKGVIFILKRHLFGDGKIIQDNSNNIKTFGKINLNPLQNNDEILKGLNEIYKYEFEHDTLNLMPENFKNNVNNVNNKFRKI